jgi:hypothetical protein
MGTDLSVCGQRVALRRALSMHMPSFPSSPSTSNICHKLHCPLHSSVEVVRESSYHDPGPKDHATTCPSSEPAGQHRESEGKYEDANAVAQVDECSSTCRGAPFPTWPFIHPEEGASLTLSVLSRAPSFSHPPLRNITAYVKSIRNPVDSRFSGQMVFYRFDGAGV